jgi:hypothetical protein
MARRTSAALAALAVPALLATLALASLPANAASSASSASSDGSSASSGSVSDSFGSSSDSSKGEKKIAEGQYRIVQVADSGQAGKLQLTLAALDDTGTTLQLMLPEATVRQAALAEGGTIHARERSYGWALAAGTAAEAREPFFLIVHDAQRREFATRKLGA